MNKLKFAFIALAVSASQSIWAGGLLTNTNNNIAFNRNFARDGAIGIDGVYSNPAGVAFLSKGLHLSFNVQNAYQTRTIVSGMTIPAFQGTPYYQPLKMNSGDENGNKKFVGEASVPFLPSIQIAKNYDKWGFQMGFSLVGGGGKCTFNDGLGSFERQIALIPAVLQSMGLTTTTPGYSVDSYIKGQQYVFGLQLGTTYKFNEHIAAYGGFRFNYIYNKYQGSITNIHANIAGNNEKLYDYIGTAAKNYQTKSDTYSAQAAAITDPTIKAQLQTAAAAYQDAANKFATAQSNFADRYLDCTQTGWGITPIVGLDVKYGKFNLGTRLEFTNHLNIENDTKVDDTGLFKDGVNTPNDLPGLFTIGGQYEILPSVRVMASYHYFFDKDAKMANDKQKYLSGNTKEYLAGAEWDVTKGITVSCGLQRTKYGLGDGTYLNDMSFVTSSHSYGFGAKIKVTKNASLNIAYFWTNYEHFKKEYTQTFSAGANSLSAQCTDDFTRTNKVLGVGLDIDL